jgi:hypothetical protein
MGGEMAEPVAFEEFAKIYRWTRELIITEKIDGTNAQVLIGEDGSVQAGSRNRYLTPEADNFGFARWVQDHAEELLGLGPGRHFGEWWGQGIQRRYGLREKRFSLFNVRRWAEVGAPLDETTELPRPTNMPHEPVRQQHVPACCHVVPVIWSGMNAEGCVERALSSLRESGSLAAPGFMQPEGIVIFHVPSRLMFKKTLDRDEEPKGARK